MSFRPTLEAARVLVERGADFHPIVESATLKEVEGKKVFVPPEKPHICNIVLKGSKTPLVTGRGIDEASAFDEAFKQFVDMPTELVTQSQEEMIRQLVAMQQAQRKAEADSMAKPTQRRPGQSA